MTSRTAAVVSTHRPRRGLRVRWAARRLVGVAAAVAVVLVARAVLGVWATAAVLAVVAVTGLIAGWAAVEARCFRRAPPPGPPVRELNVTDHVAFARALDAVATAYLTACERQEHR
jgi:uncharacterized membrane protein